MTHLNGHPIIPGTVQGQLLVSDEPLSFWGGYDQHTGEIIDRRHPLSGKIAAGHILAVPSSRGSSTTTAVLLEAIRSGTAPLAILNIGADHFFALASIVADEMYDKAIPVISLSTEDFGKLQSGQMVDVKADGKIIINH